MVEEQVLPVDPSSVALARDGLAKFDLPEPPQVNATLLLSELVTNAVVHADVAPEDTITWRADEREGRLRVEVCDAGAGFALRQRERAPDEPGGWGLVLVDTLAERWGVERADRHTCVWFELPVERS